MNENARYLSLIRRIKALKLGKERANEILDSHCIDCGAEECFECPDRKYCRIYVAIDDKIVSLCKEITEWLYAESNIKERRIRRKKLESACKQMNVDSHG